MLRNEARDVISGMSCIVAFRPNSFGSRVPRLLAEARGQTKTSASVGIRNSWRRRLLMHCYTVSAVSHQDVLRGVFDWGLSRCSHSPPDRSPGEEACAEGFNTGRLAFVQHVSASCRPTRRAPSCCAVKRSAPCMFGLQGLAANKQVDDC